MKSLEGVLSSESLAKLEEEARRNTHYDAYGYATIKRGSEADKDDVWEKDYEELIKAEHGRMESRLGKTENEITKGCIQ